MPQSSFVVQSDAVQPVIGASALRPQTKRSASRPFRCVSFAQSILINNLNTTETALPT
jgi:hypothetical protein